MNIPANIPAEVRGNRTFVSYPVGSTPHIQWNHVDGPLLHCRDGSLHWLTWRECLGMRFGRLTIDELDARHRSQENWVVPRLSPDVTQGTYGVASEAAQKIADLFSPGYFDEAILRDISAVIACHVQENRHRI